MKTMTFVGVAWLSAAILISSGCGKSELVTEMETLADRMCACEDTKCTDEVVADLEKFDKENNGKKVTKGDNEQIKAALSRATKCLTEVRNKSVPSAEELSGEAEKAAEETEAATEKAADEAESATEEVKEAGEAAGQAIDEAADEAGEAVEGAAEKAAEGAEDAAKEVEGAAEKAAEEIDEAVDGDEKTE